MRAEDSGVGTAGEMLHASESSKMVSEHDTKTPYQHLKGFTNVLLFLTNFGSC